jgi:hypothetical protein
LVLSGNKSAEASFQRRLRQLAINRARLDVDERAPMSKDKAVCAQIKPDTVSVSDPVKLFPTSLSIASSLSYRSSDNIPH